MGVESYNKRQMERLADHKIAFDQEAMWAAMQKKKKRRGLIFFFTMALVALAIVFFSWMIYGWCTSDMVSTTDLSSVQLPNVNGIPATEQSTEISQTTSVTNTSDTETTTNSEDRSTELAKSQQSESDVYAEAIDDDMPVSRVNSADTGINRSRTDRNIGDNSVTVARSSAQKTAEPIIDTELIDSSTDQNRKESKSLLSPSTDLLQVTGEAHDALESYTKITMIQLQPLDIVWPFLESLLIRKVGEDLDVDATPQAEMITPLKQISRWKIGAYVGYGQPSRDVYRILEEQEVLLDLEDEVLEEISAGIDVKYGISRHIYLSVGLDYWHVTDRRTSSFSSVTNIEDVDGESLGFEAGQTGIIVITNRDVRHTMFRTINVPLLAGVERGIGRWSAFLEAGILMNMYTTSRGELPDLSAFGEGLQVGQRFQFAPMVNLGVGRKVSDRFDIYIRGGWRVAQNVTVDRSPTEQRYSALRAQMGIRYGF